MNRTRWLLALAPAALAAGYLAAWPVPIEPRPWTAPPDPGFTGPYTSNTALAGAQRLFTDTVRGAAYLGVDRQDRLVAALSDGRLVQLDPERGQVEMRALAGGRPLGFAQSPVGVYVAADPLHGLVGARGRKRFALVTEVAGEPLRYAADVAITADARTYFIESSSRFGFGDSYAAILEHGADGRLLRYDDLANATPVLLEGLAFPVGLAAGPGDEYLLVTEAAAYRVLRYWLKGPRAGQAEPFIEDLPGLPAHITWNGRDTFWLALYAPRVPAFDRWAGSPWMRRLIYRLPTGLRPRPQRRAVVLGLDPSGRVVHNLQDPGAGAFAPVTCAREHAGWLYLGSLTQPGIARLRRPIAPGA